MRGAGEVLLSPHAGVRRVAVAGVAGAGKTTFADALAARLGVPHVELDGLYHGAGWVPRPSFLDDVRAFVADDAWVTEWQYASARPLVAGRAELLVWLDLPTPLVLLRVLRRTLRRRLRREVLWNGNVEQPLWRALVDPEHILRWAWRTRSKYRDGLVDRTAAENPGLTVVRLRSRRAVREWLAGW